MTYLYLIINLASISIPLFRSFESRVNLYSKWKSVFLAIGITAIPFLIWDQYFTHLGVWGFNPAYITGLAFGELPIEEILFFVTIPYACIFTYETLNTLIEKDYFLRITPYINAVLTVGLLAMALLNLDKMYTSWTFLLTPLFIAFLVYGLKVRFMSRFYFAYMIILIPFFMVNGVLTGSFIEDQVVWYNPAENLNIRMFTIPVEDSCYGLLLILMNVSLFEYFKTRFHQN